MGTWNPGPGPTSGDDLYLGDGSNDVADGGDGHDDLSGLAGADTLTGGNGNDVLRPGDDQANDIIDGGAGDDTVDYSNGANTRAARARTLTCSAPAMSIPSSASVRLMIASF